MKHGAAVKRKKGYSSKNAYSHMSAKKSKKKPKTPVYKNV